MHWVIKYIQELPWWAPGMIVLSFYWLPRFLLWPFRKVTAVWEHAEFGENFVLIMFVPFYLVYILSRTVEQLAEIALVIVTILSVVYLGAILIFIALELFGLILFPGETLGLGKYKKTRTVKYWEANLNRQWFEVMPGLKRKREGSVQDDSPDSDFD